MRRHALALGAIVVTLVFVTFLPWMSHAQKPTAESLRATLPEHLRPEPMPAVSENGWLVWARMAPPEEVRDPGAPSEPVPADFLAPGREDFDRAEARRVVARYKPLIELMDEGMALPTARQPLSASPDETNAELLAWTRAVHARHLRAVLALEDGRPDAAADDLIASARFAGRVVDGASTVISLIIGGGLTATTADRTRQLLASGRLDAQAERIAAAYASLPDARDGGRRALRGEVGGFFVGFIATLDPRYPDLAVLDDGLFTDARRPQAVRAALWAHPRPYNPHQTARDIGLLADPLYRAFDSPWVPEVAPAPEARAWASRWSPFPATFAEGEGTVPPGEVLRVWWRLRSLPNPLGRLFALQASEAHVTALNVSFRALALRESVRAVALYRASGGVTFPATVDPYSGEPFRVDLEAGKFWSVGPDGVDDGGDGEPERAGPDDKDFVFALHPLPMGQGSPGSRP